MFLYSGFYHFHILPVLAIFCFIIYLVDYHCLYFLNFLDFWSYELEYVHMHIVPILCIQVPTSSFSCTSLFSTSVSPFFVFLIYEIFHKEKQIIYQLDTNGLTVWTLSKGIVVCKINLFFLSCVYFIEACSCANVEPANSLSILLENPFLWVSCNVFDFLILVIKC